MGAAAAVPRIRFGTNNKHYYRYAVRNVLQSLFLEITFLLIINSTVVNARYIPYEYEDDRTFGIKRDSSEHYARSDALNGQFSLNDVLRHLKAKPQSSDISIRNQNSYINPRRGGSSIWTKIILQSPRYSNSWLEDLTKNNIRDTFSNFQRDNGYKTGFNPYLFQQNNKYDLRSNRKYNVNDRKNDKLSNKRKHKRTPSFGYQLQAQYARPEERKPQPPVRSYLTWGKR